MAVIKIDNFGGIIPRVSARALPQGSAQANKNLLATSTEFRPLMTDSSVSGVNAPAGTKTLYRMSRNANRTLLTASDESSNWMVSSAAYNIVKGPLVDDATERTYVSRADGTVALTVNDVSNMTLGSGRLLGVYSPAKPLYNSGASTIKTVVTASDNDAWVTNVAAPAMTKVVRDALTKHEVFKSEVQQRSGTDFYWYIPGSGGVGTSVTDSKIQYDIGTEAYSIANYFDIADTNFFVSGGHYLARITCRPNWYLPDVAKLSAGTFGLINLKGVESFDAITRNKFIDAVVAYFATADKGIKGKFDELNRTVGEWVAAFTMTIPAAPATLTKPVEPTNGWAWNVDTGVMERTPAGQAYDTAMASYTANVSNTANASSKNDDAISARNTLIKTLAAKAERITNDINDYYIALDTKIDLEVTDILAGFQKTTAGSNGFNTAEPAKITETRFYCVTAVNDYGEESAPSDISDMLTVGTVDTIAISLAMDSTLKAKSSIGSKGKYRIYRTNSGTDTSAFQFVGEVSASTAMFTDNIPSEALGEVCPTTTWAYPPYRIDTIENLNPKGSDPYLRDLVGMPNGILAAHLDNFVAFCHPYVPYAWPVEYQVPLEYTIVGKCAFGQSLFVGTTANPYIISGSDSASMSAQKLDSAQSCSSAASMCAIQGGVLYASPDGICFGSQAGVEVLTQALFSREDWQRLIPEDMFAISFENVYYLWFTGTLNGVTGGCLALDMAAKKLCTVDLPATAVFADNITDSFYFAHKSGGMWRAFFNRGAGEYRSAVWKSGKITLPMQQPLGWVKVLGNQTAQIPVTLKWYGDGVLVHTATISNIEPQRLPAGRYLEHEVEITSAARITSVVMAGSTQELQQA